MLNPGCMPDYGHPLRFGSFITPVNSPASAASTACGAERATRARPGDVPGSSVPAVVPGHVDAAVVGGSADRARSVVWQRAQPAVAPAGGPRTLGGEPRPAVRRAGEPWDRRRGVLGRDRGDGRHAADARPGGGRAGRGDRRVPRDLGRGEPTAAARRRRLLPRQRREARPRAGARDSHLDRRVQAAHAPAHRPQGRRLAAVTAVPGARGPAARQPPHRRGRQGGGP